MDDFWSCFLELRSGNPHFPYISQALEFQEQSFPPRADAIESELYTGEASKPACHKEFESDWSELCHDLAAGVFCGGVMMKRMRFMKNDQRMMS